MKKKLTGIVVLSSLLLSVQSCKKEDRSDGSNSVGAEPVTDFTYHIPDTANAIPGIYMITYKEEFAKPFAKVYTGSRTTRDAKTAGAEIYRRERELQIQNNLRNADGSLKVPLANITTYFSNLVVGFEAQLDKQMLKKMVEDPMVKYVELQVEENSDADQGADAAGKREFSPNAQTVDPLRQQVGYKNAVGIDYIVWIIDSGCDMDHPDLNIGVNLARNFAPNESSVEDLNGHGTKVAGIVGAFNNSYGTRGVAAGAPIVPIRVKKANNNSYPSIFVSALEYVWQKSITGDVVNMSQGFSTSINGVLGMEEAIRSYTGYDTWFAVAAGNEKMFATKKSPARMASPSYEYVDEMYFLYCVSSYGKNYNFSVAFSNYGVAIDCASAGENIYSTDIGGYVSGINGTSFATPTVAGILLLNEGAVLTKGYVKNDVDSKADKIAGL